MSHMEYHLVYVLVRTSDEHSMGTCSREALSSYEQVA